MIGTDFEVFVSQHRRDRRFGLGNVIPVPDTWELGDKHGQHVEIASGGTIHRDNVMVECCIPPVSTARDFYIAVQVIRSDAERHINAVYPRADGGNYSLMYLSTATLPDVNIKSKWANDIGCDPDYIHSNPDRPRMAPNAELLGDTRCAGGHLHVSHGKKSIPPHVVARFMDVACGSQELAAGGQGRRREFYGLAGLYRPKMYGDVVGVEYRTLSNAYLGHRDVAYAIAENALLIEKIIRENNDDDLQALYRKCLEYPDLDAIFRNESWKGMKELSAFSADLFGTTDVYSGLDYDEDEEYEE